MSTETGMEVEVGIEVGAEIELQEGEAPEEAPLILENKKNCPSWDTLVNSDDSSDDDEPLPILQFPGKQRDKPKSIGKEEQPNSYLSQLTSKPKESTDQRVANFAISKGLCKKLQMYGVFLGEEKELWTSTYHGWLAKQAKNDSSPLKHVCQRCGRQFRRMYNLEKHLCLKMAVNFPGLKGKPGEAHGKIGALSLSRSPGRKLCRQYKCGTKNSGGMHVTAGDLSPGKEAEEDNEDEDEDMGLLEDSEKLRVSDTVDMNTLEQMCLQAQNELRLIEEKFRTREKQSSMGRPLSLNKQFHPAGQVNSKLKNLQGKVIVTDSNFFGTQEGSAKAGKDPVPSWTNSIAEKEIKSPHYIYSVSGQVNGQVKPWTSTPFVCKQCGRQFRRHCNLERHVCWNLDPKFSGLKGIKLGVQKSATGQQPSLTVPSDTGKVLSPPDKVSSQELNLQAKAMPSLKKQSVISCEAGKDSDSPSIPIRTLKGVPIMCRECGRQFNRGCDFGTHLRWHMKEAEFLRLKGQIRRLKMSVDAQQEASKQASKSPLSWSSQPLTSENTTGRRAADFFKVTNEPVDPAAGKQYKCDECGREFLHKCNLIRHISWHMEANFFSSKQDGDEQTTTHSNVPSSARDLPTNPVCPSVSEEVNSGYQCSGDLQSAGFKTRPEQKLTDEEPDLHLMVRTDEDDPFEEGPYLLADEQELIERYMVMEVPGDNNMGTKSVMIKLKDNQSLEDMDALQMDLSTDWSLEDDASQRKMQPEEDWSIRIPSARDQAMYAFLGSLASKMSSRLKGMRRFKCWDCGVQYPWLSELRRHLDAQKKKGRRAHRCECGKAFWGQLHFLRHQLQHLEDTTFICATCGQSLTRYKQLLSHSRIHPNVSHFQCSCGAQFSRLPRYLWHTLRNTRMRRGR
ncbi:zinc finger protein 780B [Microcaecilia unicolor]|uniref:Zinc finger protein 780B-like n=1 Tax=Microcaecilia unicolor TaxID=1415580 RepID=A0A6P7YX34_9AMPH|nr:zinc finger protein 780B-like [Microcaecilia unicolor]